MSPNPTSRTWVEAGSRQIGSKGRSYCPAKMVRFTCILTVHVCALKVLALQMKHILVVTKPLPYGNVHVKFTLVYHEGWGWGNASMSRAQLNNSDIILSGLYYPFNHSRVMANIQESSRSISIPRSSIKAQKTATYINSYNPMLCHPDTTARPSSALVSPFHQYPNHET